jgi:signal transduction histidine kinase
MAAGSRVIYGSRVAGLSLVEPSRPVFVVTATTSPRRVALVVTAWFTAIAIVWVLMADLVVFMVSSDLELAARLDVMGDWLFVVVASGILYTIVHRAAKRLIRTQSILSAVVESIGDGVLLLGPERTIVYANPAAVKLLGCDRESELVGMTAQQFARRFRMTKTSGALVNPETFASQRAYEQPGAVHARSVLHATSDHELVIEATAAGVRSGPNERAALVVSVFHDVTASESLERLRDSFFAAAAHALKTPAAIIKANIQYTARKMPGPIMPSYQAIERQCERIDRLVQNLQVVARARSRSLELHLRRTDLAPIVAQATRELADYRQGFDLHSDIAQPVPVFGDRERLLTAVRNLALEAVSDARTRTPVIVQLDVSGASAELRVRFEPLPVPLRPFATLEDYDDTALSRCATQTIIEAHGGKVGDEEIGEDSAVRWLRLPIMEEAA